jgi:hypothetical protein
MTLVKLDTRRITDWETFHDVFADIFCFPEFYGRNLDAWIDCMTCLDDVTAGRSSVHTPPGDLIALQLEHVDSFAERCPDQYAAIIECSSFVNWRRIGRGYPPVLALSFYKSS